MNVSSHDKQLSRYRCGASGGVKGKTSNASNQNISHLDHYLKKV